MKDRSQEYRNLREQLEQVKRKCNDIVNLDEQFQGKGADAIKGFYRAQIDVVEAWLRLIDRNIAFLNGIQGSTDEKDLSGNTVIHLPFLKDELAHHIRNHKEMVASQQDELQRIFNRIDDLISLNTFSTNSFDDNIEKADKDRRDTIDAVNQLDQDLTSEYKLSEGEEQYVITLFQQLIEASRQGNTISPIHFNTAAYKASDVYQLKAQAEQQTINYLAYKKNQEDVRKQQAEIEAEIAARNREKAEFAKLNPIEKTVHSFKEIGNDFWDGLEARNEKKFDSVYDFGNYLTIGSFDTAKSMYQGMEDRAHVAMNSPYDFVNYISMGTLDLGNGAINPEESFSKEHWLSSIGLASILAGGAKPIVRGPKTPSLQDRNLVLEKTIDKAHELTTKTKSHVNYVIGEVRGGIHVLLNEMNDNNNLAYSLNSEGPKIPFNVLDTEAVKKVLDGVLSKFSFSGNGNGKVYPTRQIDSVAEAHIIDRVREIRGSLTSKYKKSGNFALAEVDIAGLNKEFYAQSKIDSLSGKLEDLVPDISLQPKDPTFKASEASGQDGKAYMRDSDTEYKILNDIASRLGDKTEVSGKIKLFTELDTCASCNRVIAEFAAKYPNIELEVIHNNGERIKPKK
jgi:hypothetical protein